MPLHVRVYYLCSIVCITGCFHVALARLLHVIKGHLLIYDTIRYIICTGKLTGKLPA